MKEYNLSTDYDQLYDHVYDGCVMLGLINKEQIPVRIEAAGNMGIVCRQIRKDWFEYRVNSIYKKEQFISECKRLNLKWIQP